ncbi:unnamed protein product [Soboliphyme baturini]|uniref:Neur_chan_LBD domain-containing protein n=1 Tax=Soboliphyme baturini TaxID=241478 RepID=A0A183IJ55_9BILA|nr:unnamed protein product [Soboliphyme baturini]
MLRSVQRKELIVKTICVVWSLHAAHHFSNDNCQKLTSRYLITCFRAKYSAFEMVWDSPVKIYHFGYVYASPEVKIHAACQFDFSKFPFDEQVCPIRLYVSGGYRMDALQFTVALSPKLKLSWTEETEKRIFSQWKVTEVTQEEKIFNPKTMQLMNDSQNFDLHELTHVLEIRIHFERIYQQFQINFILPASLTSVLTTAAMAPVQFQCSIIILLTSLMTQSTYLQYLLRIVPKSATTVPKIGNSSLQLVYIVLKIMVNETEFALTSHVLKLRYSSYSLFFYLVFFIPYLFGLIET